MLKKVPYLQEGQIERDAAALLAEYERARGVQIVRAVPIEDIVEKHLKLGIEFNDMHQLLGVPRSGLGLEPDILGSMFFDERRIVIDENLDPEEKPTKEGRYRFPLAHEGGGHWRQGAGARRSVRRASRSGELGPDILELTPLNRTRGGLSCSRM